MSNICNKGFFFFQVILEGMAKVSRICTFKEVCQDILKNKPGEAYIKSTLDISFTGKTYLIVKPFDLWFYCCENFTWDNRTQGVMEKWDLR